MLALVLSTVKFNEMTKVNFTRENVDTYLEDGKIGQFNCWPDYLSRTDNYLLIKKNPDSMSEQTEFLLQDQAGEVYERPFSFVKSYCLGFII